MESVNLFWDRSIGSYNPENGNLSQGLIGDCIYVGMLTDKEGRPDTAIYEGSEYVCLLTLDTGYGRSAISIHSKSVWEEIKKRIGE